jgi:hypothetical protein
MNVLLANNAIFLTQKPMLKKNHQLKSNQPVTPFDKIRHFEWISRLD